MVPRGSVLEVQTTVGRPLRCVLLTDPSTMVHQESPLLGVVPITQRADLPEHVLYPHVAGSGEAGNGLTGDWRVRGDKSTSVYIARILRAAEPVTAEELHRICEAVKHFYGV